MTATRSGWRRRILGRQPIGIAFVTPYAVFLAGIFAYPIGIAVYMSFHDWFFAAPGAAVDRPFVGFDNYVEALTDDRNAILAIGIGEADRPADARVEALVF